MYTLLIKYMLEIMSVMFLCYQIQFLFNSNKASKRNLSLC